MSSDAAEILKKPKWPFARWREIVRAMRPFGRRHRPQLVFGFVMSLVVIGVRLSLPWLFKEMLRPLLSGNHNHRRLAVWLSEGTVEPTLLFGGLFLILLVALGFSDFVARLKFAQFAIGTVRDLRAAAFTAALKIDPKIRPSGVGDLVARLIGDTARVKEGLKGFLIHVVTSGALLVGISAVLLWVEPILGAIFATAFVLIAAITLYGTTRVYRKASKYRHKEGKLADKIHRAWRRTTEDESFGTINRESGEHEANVTRLQGRTTWAAHVVFGLAVLIVVWMGMRAVAVRKLPTADMLMFIMYALMMRSPIVQITRQGTRTGKILACADRLEQVLRQAEPERFHAPLMPLAGTLQMVHIKIRRPTSQGRVRRLRVDRLEFAAGSRTAVIGGSGSGKTTLLQVLSGKLALKRGELNWNGATLAGVPLRLRDEQIKHLPQDPSWSKQPLWRVLGLADAQPNRDQQRLIRKSGVKPLIKRLPKGLQTVLASEAMSPGERKSVGLARMFLEGGSLFLLDEPGYGLSKKGAAKRLRGALALRPEGTLIVAMTRLSQSGLFDRIVRLRNGKIVFDGTPAEYKAHKRMAEAAARESAAEVGSSETRHGV